MTIVMTIITIIISVSNTISLIITPMMALG